MSTMSRALPRLLQNRSRWSKLTVSWSWCMLCAPWYVQNLPPEASHVGFLPGLAKLGAVSPAEPLNPTQRSHLRFIQRSLRNLCSACLNRCLFFRGPPQICIYIYNVYMFPSPPAPPRGGNHAPTPTHVARRIRQGGGGACTVTLCHFVD